MITTVQKSYVSANPPVVSDFSGDGTIYITFVPAWESLYIESKEYQSDPITFEWTWSEFLVHLDSLIANED